MTKSPQEFFSRANAEAHCRALIQRIRAAHLAGKRKKADYLSGVYLRSLDARYLATLRGNAALKKNRRVATEKLLPIAQSLNAWAGTQEKVILRLKPKENGDARKLMDYGIENRALQYLVRPLIGAQFNLHPHQYGTRAGRDAAIKRVATFLEQGYVWAIETDIKDCYPSFYGEKLSNFLPIPKKVTENVVCSVFYNLSLGHNSTFGPADGPEEDKILIGTLFADAQLGIPQGSATSALILDYVLAPVFHQLPKHGEIVGYADNILVMGKSEDDAVSMTLALWTALEANPAGHFRPKEPKASEPGDPTDFLGYRLTLIDGSVRIEPTPKNLEKFYAMLSHELSKIVNTSSAILRARRVKKLRRRVYSWTAAFKLWDGAQEHAKVSLAKIAKAS
ncbi:reverse transcriptase domain-containing protein [Mesorhizobium sp.]|uniref:reverse transcriptase domain-containing protein n=1 Tax=Mesorhizobium sp. TaxID=1871066 RepID=UPI0012051E11|nr:reverse transcriptase domain-containing protein [Mesorhizobium sp.]TIQ44616.1 MAG: hypothetical protein E5X47_28165 [Mesorhizobium sp.]TIQ54350.1 MAG: hypothetical protein E5X46_27610 [Mesorhizobium sp.]